MKELLEDNNKVIDESVMDSIYPLIYQTKEAKSSFDQIQQILRNELEINHKRMISIRELEQQIQDAEQDPKKALQRAIYLDQKLDLCEVSHSSLLSLKRMKWKYSSSQVEHSNVMEILEQCKQSNKDLMNKQTEVKQEMENVKYDLNNKRNELDQLQRIIKNLELKENDLQNQNQRLTKQVESQCHSSSIMQNLLDLSHQWNEDVQRLKSKVEEQLQHSEPQLISTLSIWTQRKEAKLRAMENVKLKELEVMNTMEHIFRPS